MVKIRMNLWLGALLLCLTPVGQAEMLFSEAAASAHGGHQPSAHAAHGRGGAGPQLQDSAGASLALFTPTLERLPVDTPAEDGVLKLPRTGVDYYHLLLAERHTGKVHEAALRYIVGRGKPSGHSPSELLAVDKTALEIVPQPLPREHWRYESAEPVAFRVRFNGTPLADTWVGLSTSNGSQLEGTTDANGMVRFDLPDDFTRVVPGRDANPGAEFVVRTGTVANDMLYRTNLSAAYYVNPRHWQSTQVGLFMLGAGFISGLIVMRRGRSATV